MAGLAFASCLFAGCAVSQKTAVKPPSAKPVILTASKQDLVARYNAAANAVNSLNATANLQLTAGSAYSGVIEQYHEVKAFILASRPSEIRVIGQAPVVGKDIFDMASDSSTFEVYIPSKNQFVTGPVNFERKAQKPVENLRPQHILDALFWQPIPADSIVLLEESDDSSPAYILTIARPAGNQTASDWRIADKISFDRTDLSISRIQSYGDAGNEMSDVSLSDWQPAGNASYPRQITLARIADDYRLHITITKLSLNEPIAADKFQLVQPVGSKLVRVGPDAEESQP
jgi:hypothetical protein